MIDELFNKRWLREAMRVRRTEKIIKGIGYFFVSFFGSLGIILFVWFLFTLLFGLSGCSQPRLRSLGNGILFEVPFELGGSDRGPLIKEYRLPQEKEIRALMRHGLQFNEGIWGDRNE